MLESASAFFSSALFMPHGHCYLWQPGMVWLQVLSNGVIAAAYVAISATLAYLVYRLRDEIPFQGMYLAFGAFIVLCGITHVFDVYVIWVPAYWLDGSVRALTAIVSAATALLLPALIPHASILARASRAARDRGIQLETAVRDVSTMYEKTKDLEALKSQFFANVSHELRTPLALILGPVERLLTHPDVRAEVRRDLEIVQRNARLLHKHVNDLLDAARLEAGKTKPRYAEVDVAALVRLVAGNFDGLAADRAIHFEVRGPASLRGQLDPDQLERVVLNLLSNAFKFTPSGGRIRCEVGERAPAPGQTAGERTLSIVVADSGPGVAPEHRVAVFERFRQLDGGSTRRAGGTGLGLAIAKEFVELQAGTISIGDAREGGAEFTVRLPLLAPAGAAVRATTAESEKRDAELTRQAIEELRARVEVVGAVQGRDKPLVLVVEDNPEMNRFVCETIGPEFRTESAFDGSSGLAKALATQPDLVLTDLMMPGMSGEDLVHGLRLRQEFARVPIVLLTAKADDELRIRLLKSGAQDYVTKPFAAEEVRARVRNLVTLKRAQDVLLEAKDATERANKELEAFSYSVSHDLRAPLRGVDGFSQALLDDYATQLDPTAQDYLARIRSAAQRMGLIIDGLLQLSRMTRADLRDHRVDLSELAKDVHAELKQGEPARAVKVQIAPGLSAQGDPRLLRIALQNLIGNAWKFTRQAAEPCIDVGSESRDGQLAFFVRDNGAGFEMQYVDKLFNPFQRLHSVDEFPGTGIGLATVQRIVARHGGRVGAESKPGGGATFWFTLPLAAQGDAA